MNDNTCTRCIATDTADIVIVSTAPPWRGGIAQYVNDLGKAFSKKFKVRILTFKRQYPKFLKPNQLGDKEPELLTELILRPFAPWTWYKTIRRINQLGAKLVVMKYWHPFFALCMGFILSRIHAKSAVIIDNIYPHEWFPFSRAWARYILIAADYLFTQSSATEEALQKILPMAVYHRIEHPLFSSNGKIDKASARKTLDIKKNDKVIMFFGYVRPYKGLQILLDAMLAPELKDVILIVAGEFYDSEKNYLRAMAQIYSRLILINRYIEEKEIPILFSAADAVILPYTRITQSGVVKLAMAYKTPIIASRVGDLTRTIKNGILVEAGNRGQLVAAIDAFYRHNDQSQFAENSGETFDDLADRICQIDLLRQLGTL